MVYNISMILNSIKKRRKQIAQIKILSGILGILALLLLSSFLADPADGQEYLNPVENIDLSVGEYNVELKGEEIEFNDEVRNYIKEVFNDDPRALKWALFTSWNEGITFKNGHREYDPLAVNGSDKHANGVTGSFGIWQFGKPTYDHWCEKSQSWTSDWKAQTRCAKKIWDSGKAFATWRVNSNAFLQMERTGQWRDVR